MPKTILKINNLPKITFHSFHLGDVEDPEIYAAQPMYQWMQTPAGKWAKENAHDMYYSIVPDPNVFGYKVCIRGTLSDQNLAWYLLKHQNVHS